MKKHPEFTGVAPTREVAALTAMHGLLASVDPLAPLVPIHIARLAVECGDALLRALDE